MGKFDSKWGSCIINVIQNEWARKVETNLSGGYKTSWLKWETSPHFEKRINKNLIKFGLLAFKKSVYFPQKKYEKVLLQVLRPLLLFPNSQCLLSKPQVLFEIPFYSYDGGMWFKSQLTWWANSTERDLVSLRMLKKLKWLSRHFTVKCLLFRIMTF